VSGRAWKPTTVRVAFGTAKNPASRMREHEGFARFGLPGIAVVSLPTIKVADGDEEVTFHNVASVVHVASGAGLANHFPTLDAAMQAVERLTVALPGVLWTVDLPRLVADLSAEQRVAFAAWQAASETGQIGDAVPRGRKA
jgi:hypothetical protein